jgi:hypothetical protein
VTVVFANINEQGCFHFRWATTTLPFCSFIVRLPDVARRRGVRRAFVDWFLSRSLQETGESPFRLVFIIEDDISAAANTPHRACAKSVKIEKRASATRQLPIVYSRRCDVCFDASSVCVELSFELPVYTLANFYSFTIRTAARRRGGGAGRQAL